MIWFCKIELNMNVKRKLSYEQRDEEMWNFIDAGKR